MPSRPGVDALLNELAASPDDAALRARAAQSLTKLGRHREAVELLRDRFVNLTAHDGPTLPCLCRRCLKPDLGETHAQDMDFARCFVVAHGRVLYYWAPSELADDPGISRSVGARLAARLA
ncbi:hypothetical protein [Enhygromyxa salina]|uniref:hypothetical protein n=1 Tax=Enhygromyxa salina TaxID=215803 RepID=UPI0006979803|nr:hypothetical protein [Enhygromyxa salina]